ncbi:MAG: hypothetical protein MUP26_04710 [Desulfobulbaceae bacterium]|nr:hypothetical protein [Desulfobulbaceae bacterium]
MRPPARRAYAQEGLRIAEYVCAHMKHLSKSKSVSKSKSKGRSMKKVDFDFDSDFDADL